MADSEVTANYYYAKYQQQNLANSSKFYSHFLYKALIVTIFLAILPLFPSQAPEFINQTLNTRGWEFLHILFVGIAVSYGLFSRRHDDGEKENFNNINNNLSKFENAQSYVSRFLQVSSFFDDEADSPPRSSSDGNKVQTWSNQYYRNEPVVVLAEENSVLDKDQRRSGSRREEKPLLLPVRSLKSRVVEADANQTSKESIGVSGSVSRSSSNLGSRRYSSKGRELGGSDFQDAGEKLKDSVVLPSPIPWRSRSGRMELKEDTDVPPSKEESENNRPFKAQTSPPSRSNSNTSSPKLSPSSSMSSMKKSSPSPSFSLEAQGKSAEDFVRKKAFHRSPPPPPPPPPPPLPTGPRKSSSMKPRRGAGDGGAYVEKEMQRSFTMEPRGGNLSVPRSVRTVRSSDSLCGPSKDMEFDDEADSMERAGRQTVRFDQSNTERLNRERVTFMPQPTFMEFPKEDEKEEYIEGLVTETDEDSDIEEEEVEEDIAESTSVLELAGSIASEEPASAGSASDVGPDVDKKADEFIAKFREQIRLQRIESIKRSAQSSSRKASR